MVVIRFSGIFALALTAALGQVPRAFMVEGVTGTSVTVSESDLARLPQQTVRTTDHGRPVVFQGVQLSDVLAKVALPAGEKFHATAASYYLAVEARDGYRAVFAWAELDPSFMDKAVYLVTRRDGKRLPENDGPFALVAPGEKRGARWVRQVKLLRIEPLPYGGAYDSEETRWIGAHLEEMQSIRAGMSRADLLKVFMEEGGLSTRLGRRYVYRRCGLIKVDVEFAPGSDPSSHRQRPDDRITRMSKPFLERPAVD